MANGKITMYKTSFVSAQQPKKGTDLMQTMGSEKRRAVKQ